MSTLNKKDVKMLEGKTVFWKKIIFYKKVPILFTGE